MDRGEREEMMVDIYEDLDSARSDEVIINTEKRSTERQQELQHTGRVSVKNRRHRSVQVCLCLLSVLLFTAVIVICVYFNNERNQLLTHNYNLTKEREVLQTHNYNLTKEREVLQTHNYNLTNGREELLRKYNKLLNQNKNKTDELFNALTDLHFSSFTWIYYKFSFYYISSDYKSWSDSRRDCKEKGADLLIINNKDEEVFLRMRTGYNIWIGLTKEQGVWKWVDGTTLTSGYWIGGYPINPNNPNNCAVMTAFGWVNNPCYLKYRWICERRIA
nr:asialoglycoprotein receptor 1-like [Misgurnus anguillicaudatus]